MPVMGKKSGWTGGNLARSKADVPAVELPRRAGGGWPAPSRAPVSINGFN